MSDEPTRAGRSPVTGWIWTANLRPLVESLAALVGYSFDQWDRDAIETGLVGTNAEDPQRWFSYPLVGTATLTVELALDPGTDVLMVRVDHPGDELLAARVDTMLGLLSSYRVE